MRLILRLVKNLREMILVRQTADACTCPGATVCDHKNGIVNDAKQPIASFLFYTPLQSKNNHAGKRNGKSFQPAPTSINLINMKMSSGAYAYTTETKDSENPYDNDASGKSASFSFYSRSREYIFEKIREKLFQYKTRNRRSEPVPAIHTTHRNNNFDMKTRLLKSGFFAVVILMASLLLTNTSFGQIAQRGVATTNTTTTTSLQITKPTGVVTGDLMIAHIYAEENGGTMDIDASLAGWTKIVTTTGVNMSNNDYRVTILYRVATAADASVANYTFALDGSADDGMGAIIAFSGVGVTCGVTETGAAGGPFDITPANVFPAFSAATDGQLDAASITTATANAGVIMFGVVNDDGDNFGPWNTTSPGTLGELYDFSFNTANLDMSIGAAFAVKGTAGATGPGTSPITAQDPNSSIMIALRAGTTITTTGVATPLCFSASPQTTSLAYTATAGSPVSYSIDWNAAANSAGLADQGATAHAFVAGAGTMTGISIPASLPAATYNGTLTISNASGCTFTNPISVTINTNPIANTNGGTGIACPLVPFQITGVTATGATIQWITSGTGTFTNGNTANPIYTPSAADAGAMLTLTVIVNSDPCPNALDFFFLTVNNVPADPANPTSNSPQCASIGGVPNGVTVTRGTPPAGVTWYWQTSATGTSTANSSLTFNATTSGTVFLRAQDNTTQCWSTGAGSVAVTVVPTAATPSAITNPTNAPCANVAGLIYSVTNVAGLSYLWTVPTGWQITSGQGTNSITVTSGAEGDNGNISVVAISTDGTNQCTASAPSNLAVTVANSNNIGFNGNIATNVLEICAGTTGTTINGGNPTGGETFAWQVSTVDPVSGPFISVLPDPGDAQNWTISSGYYNIAGTYYFRRVITASTICNSNSDVVTLIVHDAATANAGTNQDACAGGSINLSGSIGGGAMSSTWSAPSGSFGDATSLTTTYTPSITSGSVVLTLTTDNPAGPCPAVSSTMTVTISTVNFSPTAVTNITTGATVNFTDLTTPTPTAWLWTFEGGTPATSTLQNPSVTYNSAGSFDVTLTVTNSCGNPTLTRTDHIIVTTLTSPVTFNANGSFVVPAGVTCIKVDAWGAGGGGGNDAANNNAAGGGGGGAYASSFLSVGPGTIPVTVGTGGAAATAGGPSSFGTTLPVLVQALGGGSSTSFTGGTGGQASGSTGTIKFSGGNGGTGTAAAGTGGGGGGSSASASGNGVNGNTFTTTTGGAGGNGPDGDGGTGGNNATANAQNGTAPGGGGGGRGDNGGTSGSGANGRVTVTWFNASNFGSSASSPLCLGSGSTVTVNSTTLSNGGYTVTYTLSGANNSSQSTTLTMTGGTGTFNIPAGQLSNAGITDLTINTITITGWTCGTTLTTGNTACIVIFPATPAAPTVNAGCGLFTVTPPATVAGFNIEYSFDDGSSWGTNTPPTAENCAGYKIRTRYVTALDCGSVLAGTASSNPSCGASPATTRVIDLTPPTGTASGGTGLNACKSDAEALFPFDAVALQSDYTDNCGAVTITLTNTELTGTDCGWTLTYTFDVSDACGNILSGQTIIFTGSDQSAPTGTAPTGTNGINACYIDGTTPPTGAPLFDNTEVASHYSDCGGVTVTLDNTTVSGGNCGWTLVYSYSVTDGCGNSVQHSISHTGSDQIAPTGPQPAPIVNINACFVDNATLPAGVPFLTAVPAEVLSQYSDNCGGGVLSNSISLLSITGDNCAWTVTYSFSVKDACGNILPGQTLTYSGSDQTPPTASDPVASFVSGIASVPAADPSVVTDEADNCAVPTVTLFSESNNGGTGCSGDPYIVTRIYRVSDGCNHIDVTHMITAIDDIEPTASNPAPINVSCISNVPAADPSVVTDEADDYSTPTVAFLSESDNGGTGCTGSPYILTRTYRVTDACGNFTDVTQTITALDDVNPTASDPDPINVSCINDIPAADPSVVTDEADNCSAPTVALFNESNNGGTGCAGSPYILTRTYRVTDACGNFIDVTQTITVEDNIAPVLSSTPSNTTVSCNAIPGVPIITATDNCDPFVTVTFSETSDQGTDPLLPDYYNYTITRTWTATDDCGNQASNTQLITVQDISAPVLVKGTVNSCYPTAGAAADAVEAATSILDGCAGYETLVIDVTSTTIPGTCNRNLTVTATDPSGNSSSVVYNTIRIDNTPPVIGTQAADMTVQCGPGNAASLATWLNSHGGAVATDPGCNGILTWTHNFTALSDLCGATGAATVTFTVTDACGMSSTTTATFTIIDTQGPTITTQASGQTVECDGNGNTAALQAWLDNHGGAAANDPCSGVVWTHSVPVFTDGCGATGVATVTFTATDACGNASTTTANFTIADTQGPALSSLPANATAECDAIPSAPVLTATDICGGNATVTFTETSNKGTDEFDCSYYNYTITRTWTATDACGNPTTHTQMITVQDTKAPVITVNAPINTCYPTLALATSAAFAAVSISDNCATDYLTLLSGSTGTCTVRITIIAIDPCGNQSTQQFTSRVDNTPPTLTAPASPMTVECGPGMATALANWLNNHGGATVSDACGGITWTHDFTQLSDGCGASGSATVTFTASDACGNTITTTATFTVVDTQAPVFSLQATGQTVECDGNGNAAQLQAWLDSHGGATASDACGGITWSSNYTSLSDGCGATGTATVTFTATDDCGNASSTTATFTITDTQGPALSSEPGDITVDCDVVPSAPVVTATDNCSGSAAVTFTEESTQVLDPGDCGYYTYTITRTWTAQDDCGNTTTHTQTINVKDDSAPVLTKGTINACYPTAQAAGAAAILATEVSENCTTEEYVFFSATFSGGCNAVVTVSATDPCGNTSTVTYNTRVDNTAPGVTGTLTTLNAQGCSAADAPAAATTAAQLEAMGLNITDICTPDAQLIITYSDASSGSTCPTVVTRTYTIADACGKFTTRTQTININDNTPPSITGSLAPLSVEGCNASAAPAGASSVAALQALGVTVSDACAPGSLTVTYSDGAASGTCPLTFTRTYTVTDGCGNAANVQQSITVSDNTAPDVNNCPANVLANTGPGRTTCDAIVSWTEPTATDNCNGTLTYSSRSHAPGSVFPVGQTTVTYTFTDNCGNPASCSFIVNVSDNTAPAITSCAPAQTGTVNSSCQAAVPDVTGLITASDNCPGTLTVSQSPAAGTLVGGGVTNIVITVLDQEGNFSQCTTTFTVAGGSGGSLAITCPPDITVNAASGQCSATVSSLGLPTVTGGCGTMTVSNNHPSTLYPLGQTIVTWTVTNGTTTRTCTQKVTVVDNLSPSFTTCPANITTAMSTTSCNKSVSVPNPAYSDNCGVTKLTWVMTGATTGSSSSSGINFVGTKTFNGGVTTITYTAKDAAGNQSTCSFTVTVQDSKNPTINCPSNINVTTSNGACGRSIGTSNPIYSDNCAVTKLTWIMTGATTGNSPSTGINNVGTKTFNVGVTNITYTAYDAAGNSSSCTFKVTVRESRDPDIDCPADQFLCKKSNNIYTIPEIEASDNCSNAGLTVTYSIIGATWRSGTGPDASGFFNPGVSFIKWTVTDFSGNSDDCWTRVVIRWCNGNDDGIFDDQDDDDDDHGHGNIIDPKVIGSAKNGTLEINAYPNPSPNFFNLKVKSSTAETVEIRVFNMQGQLVQKERGAAVQVYRLGDKLVNGMYIIEVAQGSKAARIKVIKQ